MKSVNIVNVNGCEFFVDGHDSFMEMMEHIGISEEDVSEYSLANDQAEELKYAREHMYSDGVTGDDFYQLVEEMNNYLEAFKVAADCLRKPSRKGYTRADMADYIDTTCSNFETIIP
jgi:hypothetical protein